MTVDRFAISFEPALAAAVRRAAAKGSTSAWLADAARRKLRAEGLLDVIASWEQAHGELTTADLATARRAARRKPRR